MATFTVDPTDPSMVVMSGSGIKLPVTAVAPADIVASPVAPAGASLPVLPPAPGMTPRAQAVMNKRDTVMGPLEVSSVTTNTQKGLAPSVLNPVLQSNVDATESLATQIENQGAAKTERETKRISGAMAEADKEIGKAREDEATARQRGEIARLNGLAIAAQQDPEVDPGRFVDNMSTGRKLGLIITAAITGAVAGIQGRAGEPSPIVGMLMNAIEQDLAAQKEAIASGRIRRGNMIQWFRDQGMTEKDAEIAARGVATSMAARKFELEGELSKVPEHAENAKLMAAQLRTQTEKENNNLVLSLGTDRQATSVTKERPKPAGGAADLWKEIEARHNLGELASTGNTPEQNKEIRQEAATLADKLTPTLDMVNALDGVYSATGIARSKDGKLVPPKDIPGKGVIDSNAGFIAPEIFRPQAAQAVDAAIVNAKDVLGRMRSGGAITEDELKTFSKLLDATTEASFVTKMQQFDRFVRARAADIAARSSDPALAEFGRRRDRGAGSLSTPVGATKVEGPIP